MRVIRPSATVGLIATLLFASSVFAAAGSPVSGTLIFENRDFSCDSQCRVTLMLSGVRPVETVVVALGGRFAFTTIPRGSFSLRVEIDGFESYTYPVRDFESSSITIFMPMVAKRSPSSQTGAPVVDVSEFLERYPKKAVSYFEKGSELRKKNKNDEAVKYFQNAVELAPTFYEAHQQLGLTYRAEGRNDDAEREFVTAHELNSTAVEPLLNLIVLYLDENDPARAVTTGELAVKVNRRSAMAFFTFGVALYRTSQLDRAEAALKRALDLAPRMPNIRLMLANVYAKLLRYDNSIEQLNAYITENPRGEQLNEAMTMRDKLAEARPAEQP